MQARPRGADCCSAAPVSPSPVARASVRIQSESRMFIFDFLPFAEASGRHAGHLHPASRGVCATDGAGLWGGQTGPGIGGEGPGEGSWAGQRVGEGHGEGRAREGQGKGAGERAGAGAGACRRGEGGWGSGWGGVGISMDVWAVLGWLSFLAAGVLCTYCTYQPT